MPKSKLDYLKKYSSSSKKKGQKDKVDKLSSSSSSSSFNNSHSNLKCVDGHGFDYPDQDEIDVNKNEKIDLSLIEMNANTSRGRGEWTSSSILPVSPKAPAQAVVLSTTNNNNSDSDEDSIPRRPQNNRSDSDSDEDSIPRRKRREEDLSGDDEQEQEQAKMSSGHVAGLQSGKDYKVIDEKIRERQKRELESVDANLSGAHASTIYRDKSGIRQDVVADAKEQELIQATKQAKKEKAMKMLNEGTMQRHQREQAAQELAYISNKPFARTVDDADMEHRRKYVIRDGDPMAAYMASKQKDEEALLPMSTSSPSSINRESGKPVYKGPPAPQNRFNIGPGYRWDGIPRGNGFEEKVLQVQMQISGKGGGGTSSLNYY